MAGTDGEGVGMGLKSTIESAVKAGFAALGDIVETVTYKSYASTSSYNPDTGTVTRTETSLTVGVVFMEYNKRDIDGVQIQAHDQRVLIRQAALSVTPSLNDRIVRSTGKIWEIISVGEDPAHATWDLQVRSTNG